MKENLPGCPLPSGGRRERRDWRLLSLEVGLELANGETKLVPSLDCLPRYIGGEAGSGDAAEEGKEKLLPPPPPGVLLAWSWPNKGFCDLIIKYESCNVWLHWKHLIFLMVRYEVLQKSTVIFFHQSSEPDDSSCPPQYPWQPWSGPYCTSACSNSPLSEERFRWIFSPS